MSLIIEDKNALDSLANAIIGANGSVDKTSATKGELTDIINNIIPLKASSQVEFLLHRKTSRLKTHLESISLWVRKMVFLSSRM